MDPHIEESDPIGVTWATTWTVAMSTWPAYARPVPPVGDPELPAVILGNLHDPKTAYENAQHMKKAFPQGQRAKIGGQKHLVCGFGNLVGPCSTWCVFVLSKSRWTQSSEGYNGWTPLQAIWSLGKATDTA